MQEFGKNYIAIAFFSMFLIPALRSVISTDELDGVVETIAAFLWPIGIPAIVVYDLVNRNEASSQFTISGPFQAESPPCVLRIEAVNSVAGFD